MKQLPKVEHNNVIAGFDHNEDASVYDMGDHYLVSTLDMFGANHPDPFTFGQIAASNALSDVFAMGGEVLYALNVLCIPDELPADATAEILKGAMERLSHTTGVIVGGHTVSNTEILYGLSVTGKVKKENLLLNNQAQPKQNIVLTKKIGTGVYNKYIKHADNDPDVEEVIQSMISMNDVSAKIALKHHLKTCTDVTGFGLGGHLIEVLDASNISATLDFSSIPMFARTMEFASNVSGGMTRNILHFSKHVRHTLTKEELNILFDPQTSGGLLLFVDPSDTENVIQDLNNEGLLGVCIGNTTEREGWTLQVK